MRKVNVLWAEDKNTSFVIYSKKLRRFLKSRGVDAIITQAKDGDAVYRHLSDQVPDVLIVDIAMDITWNGIETVSDLGKKKHGGMPMIIVSDHANEPKYTPALSDLTSMKIIQGFYVAGEQDEWCEAVWRAINLKPPTILHISDIHFGSDHAFTDRLQIEELLSDALDLITKEVKLDIIVVSGDLSSKGTDQELKRAEDFLSAIASKLNLDRSRFILIPGNHDIVRAEAAGNRFTKFVEFLDNFYGNSPNGEETLKRYPELYQDQRNRLRWDAEKHKEESLYSISVFDEFKTIVIGLNSIVSTDENRFNLSKIEPLQLLKIKNALKGLSPRRSKYFRIAAFHHNLFMVPSFTGEGEPERLVRNSTLVLNELIQNQVKLVLHGHTHYSMAYKYQPYFFDGDQKISAPIYVFGAGTLSGKDLPASQSHFHLSLIRCELDEEGNVSSAVVLPYQLKDDWMNWGKASSVHVDFSK